MSKVTRMTVVIRMKNIKIDWNDHRGTYEKYKSRKIVFLGVSDFLQPSQNLEDFKPVKKQKPPIP